MPDFADDLIAELDAAPCWPLPREHRAIKQALRGRAWRRSDRDVLKAAGGIDADRKLYVDPLARRIAFGFADFLFSEDTRIVATSDGAQGEVDAFIEVNGLQSRLHRAERIVISEGEAWWKLHTNIAIADTPLITFCSRRDVVPLMYGDQVLAVAFVTERAREAPTEEEREHQGIDEIVWRHAEVHCDGRVVNLLYRGTVEELGTRLELAARRETATMNPQLEHGLPMWAGRVVNDLDDEDALGVSEYEAVEDLLHALNEAVTIAAENARLTGQDRFMVAGKITQQDGSFDASMQVLQVATEGAELGDGGSLPIMAIEKRYDAEPLWLHVGKLVHTILSRVGLVAAIVGQDEEGKAESGTARRLRFMPTTNAANGKLREWRRTLPKITGLVLAITALDTGSGGYGRSVEGGLEELPAVEFGDPVPIDEAERTTTAALAVTSEIMSRETAVREQHPDWSSEQVDDELGRIREDLDSAAPDPVDPPDGPPAPEELPEPEPVPA